MNNIKNKLTERVKNAKGFTLIELMATLAILALIIAIAIPAVGNLLDKADTSADDSSIELMERAGELADVDGLEHDEGVINESGGTETEAYRIPTLIAEGYLNMEEDNKFNKPENYVVRVNASGTYIYKGEGQRGGGGAGDGATTTPADEVGFIDDIDKLTCEQALAGGYDKCLYTVEDVKSMQDNLDWRYIVMNDIDLGGENWEPIAPVAQGGDLWEDIESGAYVPFSGELNGNGYAFQNLTSERSESHTALISVVLGGLVKNLEVNAELSGGSYTGAIAGMTLEAEMDNVIARGTITTTGNASGGLVGENSGGTEIKNAKSYVAVTGGSAPMIGGAVGHNLANMDNVHYKGTVSSQSDMTGGLVGAHHQGVISNSSASVTVESSGDDIGGLIGYSSETVLGSFSLGEVHSSSTTSGGNGGSAAVGGLIGDSQSLVENSYSEADVFAAGSNVGGLIGLGGTSGGGNVYATGNVEAGGDFVGGLIGYKIYPLVDAYATGNVKAGGGVVGGLAGHNGGSIANSNASGSVTADGSAVGGLVGLNNGAVTGSHATGDVSADGNPYTELWSEPIVGEIGGLFGRNTTQSSDVFATGDVSGTAIVGGLVGQNSGPLTNAYATGNVTSSAADAIIAGSPGSFTGGLIGVNNSDIRGGIYATGDVVAVGDYVGGLAGKSNGGIFDGAYTTGDVTTDGSYVGGISGQQAGTTPNGLVNFHASGNVKAGGDYIGGLFGSTYYDISNSYFTGSVATDGDIAGGLAGQTYGIISNSYVSGTVEGGASTDVIVGAPAGLTAENVYWNSDLVSSSAYGEGKTAAELKDAATFTGWDFDSVWIMGDAFPELQ